MPYNTRRKSLSLPSLGIHLPVTHAARAAAAAAAAAAAQQAAADVASANGTSSTTTASSSGSSNSSSSSSSSPNQLHPQPPNKKMKRSHASDPADSSPSPKREQLSPPRGAVAKFELRQTPPPSPPESTLGDHPRRSMEVDGDSSAPSSPLSSAAGPLARGGTKSGAAAARSTTTTTTATSTTPAAPPPARKVSLEGINDEIVEAVIVQLQETGNRPHHVKELATVLLQQLKIVQQSANPCAIISSRLSTYLKRGCWTALAPCPLAKELETVHPRRTYFYLTTYPHQPLPDPSSASASASSSSASPAAACSASASSVHSASSRLLHQLQLQQQARAALTPAASVVGGAASSSSRWASTAPPSVDEGVSTGSSALSSAEDDDDDAAARRRELSPSPEIDLSSPELDDIDDDVYMPGTPLGGSGLLLRHPRLPYIVGSNVLGAATAAAAAAANAVSAKNGAAAASSRDAAGSDSSHHHHNHHDSSSGRHHHRGASPPLEKDEREFTQTADGLQQKRRLTGGRLLAPPSPFLMTASMDLDDLEDLMMVDDADRNSNNPASFFGGLPPSNKMASGVARLAPPHSSSPAAQQLLSSPAMLPTLAPLPPQALKLDAVLLGWDRSPENIELEELDYLLDEF